MVLLVLMMSMMVLLLSPPSFLLARLCSGQALIDRVVQNNGRHNVKNMIHVPQPLSSRATRPGAASYHPTEVRL